MPLRTRYAREVTAADHNTTQTLAGWVQDVQALAAIAFVKLRDGTGLAQVTLPKKKVPPELFEAMTKIARESVITVTGNVAPSNQAKLGWELIPAHFTLLNEAQTPLPLGVADKVSADLETRLDNRFMDLRKPEIQAIFRVRSALVRAGSESFHKQHFVQTHTPRIIGASSEGGTDLFAVKYFEKSAFLAQSPQLYKQMIMATGLDRQFEVATYFRAEKHNSYRHLNEVTAFDVEMAWIESEEDVMGVLETAVRDMWAGVRAACETELALLGKDVKIPELPFLRVPYGDALDMVNATGKWTDEHGKAAPIPWGDDLNAAAEKLLGEVMAAKGHAFYFLTQYPEQIRPFYTFVEEDGKTTRSFDLEHNGLEVTSGAQRQHHAAKLEERLRHKGLDPADFQDYLKPFRYGMPPHGGFGLGIDRLTMEILGLPNVREAVLFPRDRTRLAP